MRRIVANVFAKKLCQCKYHLNFEHKSFIKLTFVLIIFSLDRRQRIKLDDVSFFPLGNFFLLTFDESNKHLRLIVILFLS